MKAGRSFVVCLTVATNHPVSAFLNLASRCVFANTLFSWVRGGLGKAFGLRKVRRCLIAGVSLMLDILKKILQAAKYIVYSHVSRL